MNSPFERIRPALTASLAALALILTAVLTPDAVRPPLGAAPAHAAALTAHAHARHTQDDPQELLHADPVAFAVPPIDMGDGHVLHSRWKIGIFDLGTASTCGPYAVGLIICLDGTCPDSSTFTMVFFAPSAFHPTFIEALEDAVAAREAIERSAGDALPPPPSPSGSGGSIPIVPMPTVTREDCDPAAFEAQAAACANTPNICDRLICRLQLCRIDAVCRLMTSRNHAQLDRNYMVATGAAFLVQGSAGPIVACGKFGLAYFIGSRLLGIGTIIWADYIYQRKVRDYENIYKFDLVRCKMDFEEAWKTHQCP